MSASLNAYSTTKHFSPRLVQHGAELIERNITNPVVSTVSTVGRMTGVESGLRWYYGGGQRGPSDGERGDEERANGKRRRVMDDEMEVDSGPLSPRSRLRRDSEDSRVEYLPAYRASKPPSYREEASPSDLDDLWTKPHKGLYHMYVNRFVHLLKRAARIAVLEQQLTCSISGRPMSPRFTIEPDTIRPCGTVWERLPALTITCSKHRSWTTKPRGLNTKDIQACGTLNVPPPARSTGC